MVQHLECPPEDSSPRLVLFLGHCRVYHTALCLCKIKRVCRGGSGRGSIQDVDEGLARRGSEVWSGARLEVWPEVSGQGSDLGQEVGFEDPEPVAELRQSGARDPWSPIPRQTPSR